MLEPELPQHVERAVGASVGHGRILNHRCKGKRIADVEVHRRKPDVGDGVELLQGAEHELAHVARLDLAVSEHDHRLLDGVDRLLKLLGRHGTLIEA